DAPTGGCRARGGEPRRVDVVIGAAVILPRQEDTPRTVGSAGDEGLVAGDRADVDGSPDRGAVGRDTRSAHVVVAGEVVLVGEDDATCPIGSEGGSALDPPRRREGMRPLHGGGA